jgi:hypothetical protein
MKRLMHSVLLLLVMISLLAPARAATTTSYSMKITVSMPKGSAGEKLDGNQPSGTKFSPCDDAKAIDAVTFSLSYNAGSTASDLEDVYLFFYSLGADGVTVPRYILFKKGNMLNSGPVFRLKLQDIDPADDIYLPREINLGGAVSETLLGGSITVDSVDEGTYQLIGIVADRSEVDFDDPSTWDAWDAATVILGKPWAGPSKSVCE